MPHDRDPDLPRANPLEILGAWLRVWTPPRDVEIPPFPRRAGAVGAVILLLLVAVVVLVIAPAIDTSKRAGADREARAEAAARARREAIALRDQAPRLGRDAHLAPAHTTARRHRLVADVQRAITADANRRYADGTVDSRTRSTSCAPFLGGSPPEDDPARSTGVYDCTALIGEIVGEGRPGRLGYPFRAVLDFEHATWAFCKVNPIPGEQSLPDPRTVVPLPRPCQAPS